jgi:sugar lactone lactonase YvrE
MPIPIRQPPATALAVASLVLCGGCAAYDSTAEAPDHDIEVLATDVAFADGLAFHPSGAILASEEYRGGGVVRIDPVSGVHSHLVRDLSDPDNLVVVEGHIYVTEEDTKGRILRLDERQILTTFASGLNGPEGLDLGPDGMLYVAEHAPGGHVYRYSLDGSRETVGSVQNGEGLRCLPDGSVIVAETSENRVSRFLPDGSKVTVVEGSIQAPDGVAYDPTLDRLLVTEDAAPGRMLQVDIDTGDLTVIATGLNLPQTMLFEEDGSILVAEQGEHRILRLRPRRSAP